MSTIHRFFFQNSDNLDKIKDNSVDLVVTSPPYPMIGMWDEIFELQNPKIGETLRNNEGDSAFELMHSELDKVWSELFRVMKQGAIACINIGDATRKVGSEFRLYSNHSRILNCCSKIGFTVLPEILWRKATNSPTKFLGSGMLPAGAYVTLEHEFILILRKGNKREFLSKEEKLNRNESSYFWEERNTWFSDLWNLNGIKQNINSVNSRKRSAAFPFELAYRLINMFSVKNDTVLDPFLGTGTTTLASIASNRNSIGVEIDEELHPLIKSNLNEKPNELNFYIKSRIEKHVNFIEEKIKNGKKYKYINANYNIPVTTRQEMNIKFDFLKKINFSKDTEIIAEYSDINDFSNALETKFTEESFDIFNWKS